MGSNNISNYQCSTHVDAAILRVLSNLNFESQLDKQATYASFKLFWVHTMQTLKELVSHVSIVISDQIGETAIFPL